MIKFIGLSEALLSNGLVWIVGTVFFQINIDYNVFYFNLDRNNKYKKSNF